MTPLPIGRPEVTLTTNSTNTTNTTNTTNSCVRQPVDVSPTPKVSSLSESVDPNVERLSG
jgi:hypothetical protein